MTQYIVTHIDGSKLNLHSRAKGTFVESAKFRPRWQSYAELTLEITAYTAPEWAYFDRIVVDDTPVFLHEWNEAQHIDNKGTKYILHFYGIEKMLFEASPFLDIDSAGAYISKDKPPIVGNLELFGNVLCNCINYRAYNTATGQRYKQDTIKLGTCPAGTKHLLVSTTEYNAFAALLAVCSAFKTHYTITTNPAGDTDYLLNFGVAPGVYAPLAYGRGKGLYRLDRKSISSENVKTILTVLGSSKNLPQGYGKQRLELDETLYPGSIIADNDKIQTFGAWNDVYIAEDIMPEYRGEILGVDTEDKFTFYCELDDFDPTGGTLNMLTGSLAGSNFRIAAFNAASGKVTVEELVDSSGFAVPSVAPYLFATGDTFTIVDIPMPQAYIEIAQQALAEAGQARYLEISQPRVAYNVALHSRFVKNYGSRPKVGMYFPISDARYGVNKAIQCVTLERNLLAQDEYEYTNCEVADNVVETLGAKIYKQSKEAQALLKHLGATHLTTPTSSLQGAARTAQAAAVAAAEAVAALEAEAARIAAEAYADGILSAEEAARIDDVAAKLTEAKQYAAAQAAAAESAAKTYAEGQAAAAQAAAEAVAAAEAEAAELAANAYADGIVTAEEQRAIAEAAAKLTEAKNYAESQASAAESAASTYAAAQAEAARLAAIASAKTYTDTQLGNFATTVTADISDLQNQIDGNITTWFYAYVPTTSNAPASGWTTTALKNQHIGDLFYVNNDSLEEDGFCYRWTGTAWELIKDTQITKALADAAEAKDTADSKRRVFVATPTTPYDIGDLWLKSGDLYKCKVTRATGSYVASDWEKGVKYTDDTVANDNLITAQQYADAKKLEAIAAAEDAAEAEALAAQIAAEAYADGIVTAAEAAAIAAAAADATAKANAAQAAAEAAAAALDAAIQVGGRNLLKDTKAEVRTTSYLMKNYYLGSVKPQEGEQVTIMFRGALGTGKTYFGLYNSGGSVDMSSINDTNKGADGIYRKTFNWVISTASNTYLSLYQMFSSVTAESWVAEMMLVIGNKVAYYSEAPEDIQAEIDAAQSAAESYALAKANLAETTAKAYADGIVSAEEARAIADATAKANAAKAAAEATAAALDDAIQIGGRNLLDDSNDFSKFTSRPLLIINGTTETNPYGVNNATLVTLHSALYDAYRYYNRLIVGRQYTISLWVKLGTATNFVLTPGNGNTWNTWGVQTQVTGAGWQRIQATFTANGTILYIHIGGNGATIVQSEGTATIYGLQLEEGNKATDWTPAPEDVDADIAAAKTEAENAAKDYADAKAEAERVLVEAYADGIVDAEEARAIADATAKANAAEAEAKRYAAEIAIAQGGKMLYKDPTFKIGTNGTYHYNNAGGTGTAWERVAKPSDCPSDSTHIMRYSVNGTPYSPGYGGFSFGTWTRANAVFVVKIIAKIPAGLTLNFTSNAYGTGGIAEFLTPVVGTGKYETYYHKLRCGSSGTFSNTNYFFLTGSVTVPFAMDVAFATVYDITLFDDTAEQAAAAAAEAVTTAASDATSKMNAAKDALAVRLGYTNYAAMAAEAAATGKLIVGGLLNANIIDVQTLVGLEAFLTRLVARNISTTPNAEGWFVRIDDDDPTVFEVRRLVNGVIDENNYIKFGILSSSTPQLLIKWNSANIRLDPAGLSVELLGKYVYLSSEGLSVHTPDMSPEVANQLLTMMKDYIVITKLALSSLATAYSSSYPTMVWKDSKGYLKIGNAGSYTAADVGALPTNTIQYFTQAQWAALTQEQKNAVPLALVQE